MLLWFTVLILFFIDDFPFFTNDCRLNLIFYYLFIVFFLHERLNKCSFFNNRCFPFQNIDFIKMVSIFHECENLSKVTFIHTRNGDDFLTKFFVQLQIHISNKLVIINVVKKNIKRSQENKINKNSFLYSVWIILLLRVGVIITEILPV